MHGASVRSPLDEQASPVDVLRRCMKRSGKCPVRYDDRAFHVRARGGGKMDARCLTRLCSTLLSGTRTLSLARRKLPRAFGRSTSTTT